MRLFADSAHRLDPVMGGLFTESSSGWRWSFYLNIVAGGLIISVYLFILPSHRPMSGLAFWKRLVRIDFVGFALF